MALTENEAKRYSRLRYTYVAGPYTKPDPAANTDIAIAVGDKLFSLGFYPHVPHLYHFWHARHPRPYTDWTRFDFATMRRYDAIFLIPGESSGAADEVALAKLLNMPVFTEMADMEMIARNFCACDPGTGAVCSYHASTGYRP